MDLGTWLRGLGLEEYEAVFRDNKVDERSLSSLTAEDLKELGVAAIGHRRILLDAIAALRADRGANATANDAVVPSAARTATPEDRAERRQVTVMFSDLVGSTALSTRIDPEDLREVISTYHKCVAETVQRFAGFVAHYMGDGVLIYFGYPEAHEDDAERAVRAGLALVAAISALKTHAALQARVGIATGLVVVGDLIGSGASQQQSIVGETPNLAARLQSIAEPNTVVIAESTRKLVGDLFELEDLGARDLKGIVGPVRAWAALRPSSIESRFEALHANRLAELVGREEELELLLRRWSKAKAGEGRVVLLSGEAGIGKSRLTAALLERLSDEPHTRVRNFCSPQHTDSAFFPIIGQLERAAALTRNDNLQTKLDKLDLMLAQSSTSAQDAGLLAQLLSFANDGRYPTLDLTPQQRRQRTLEALVSQIVAVSRRNPLLMIFEDAHWADPTSLELFGRIVDRIPTLRVLLIVTFRPEFEPPWIGRPYVTLLTINRLAQREIDAMIDGVIGNELLPPNIRQDIIERTDGIPLFVEEMTRAALEAKDEETAERTVAAVPSPSIAVPASLHASLMARLDRLGTAKEIAQIGAAAGREFTHALLAAVIRKPQRELELALDRIVQAGLLFRQGVPPHASYLFKHALIQDAAYGTLLREPRRALHARIAESLEREFPEIAQNQPEILARHCTEAGLIEKAAELWGKAGQRSLERSALIEAVTQLTRALDQIATQSGTPALRREQIKLQVGLMNALQQAKGHAAQETRAAAERARLLIENAEALGEPADDPLLLFSVLWSFWVANFAAFNGEVVRELASESLTLAEKQKTSVPLMIAHRSSGIAFLHTGDIARSRLHFDRAIALYDTSEHRPLATRFGGDIGATILVFRSLALWILGYPASAQTDTENALRNARETGHAVTLMYALTHASMTHLCCGNYAAASAKADELVALAGEKGSAIWKAYGVSRQGFLAAVTDKAADAVQIITLATETARSTGSTLWMPLNLLHLARAHAALGKFDDAWRCIGEAMTAMATTKETWWEAEVDRIAGEISLMSPAPDAAKAEAYFERALVVARQQQAKSWELRACMSLARLWRSQGKVREGRDLLAPVYGWFTEGFDTLDLKEARAMLAELA